MWSAATTRWARPSSRCIPAMAALPDAPRRSAWHGPGALGGFPGPGLRQRLPADPGFGRDHEGPRQVAGLGDARDRGADIRRGGGTGSTPIFGLATVGRAAG